jgi:hypothetical protein
VAWAAWVVWICKKRRLDASCVVAKALVWVDHKRLFAPSLTRRYSLFASYVDIAK